MKMIELETAALFLTNRTDLIDQEIHHNCISIGMTNELSKNTTENDILAFLYRTKLNRQNQLKQCNLNINLIYYLWFDEMAGQLRFNFINSNHQSLPFKCELSLVNDEKEIINSFLRSPYIEGIQMHELSFSDSINEVSDQVTILNVYVQQITRDGKLK